MDLGIKLKRSAVVISAIVMFVSCFCFVAIAKPLEDEKLQEVSTDNPSLQTEKKTYFDDGKTIWIAGAAWSKNAETYGQRFAWSNMYSSCRNSFYTRVISTDLGTDTGRCYGSPGYPF